jgi:hypothetical protein
MVTLEQLVWVKGSRLKSARHTLDWLQLGQFGCTNSEFHCRRGTPSLKLRCLLNWGNSRVHPTVGELDVDCSAE